MYIFARNQSVESSTFPTLSRIAWVLVLLAFFLSDTSAYQTHLVLSGTLESKTKMPRSIALPLH